MDKLIDFIQEKQVGLWCKRAAWIIAALGVVNIILGIFAFLPLGAGYPFTSAQIINAILQTLRLTFSTAISALFYFFVLYAVGTLVENLIGKSQQDALEEDEEEDEEEGVNEALMPGQRLH